MPDQTFQPRSADRRQYGTAANPAMVATCLILVVLLPIIYVLSIGPIVAISERTGVGHHAVEVFYAPVIWLHEHTVLKEPLEWYAELWGWK